MHHFIQAIKVRAGAKWMGLMALISLIVMIGLGEMAWATDCSGNVCPIGCGDFAGVMETRQPFYYAGEFEEACVNVLAGEGIRVREEGASPDAIIILTTNRPFPFVSEWVGRRARNPVAWRFEKYGF